MKPLQKISGPILIVFFMGVVVASMHFFSLIPSSEHPLVGTAAPEFGLLDLDQADTVGVSEFRGQVVLMDFWATWCPPCREQMPILQAIDSDASLKGKVKVVSINTDEADDNRLEMVQKFMDKHGYSMLTLMDNRSVSRLYQVRGIPTLVVIDADGVIRKVSAGKHSEARIREYIREASIN